jgi:hypothetical protein
VAALLVPSRKGADSSVVKGHGFIRAEQSGVNFIHSGLQPLGPQRLKPVKGDCDASLRHD